MCISRKKFIWGFYFITLTIVLLDTTDNFPGTATLRLIKYLFLVLILFENLFNVKAKRVYWVPIVYVGLLFLHTCLFGLVFVNPSIQSETLSHFRQMMIFIALAFFAARYCFLTNTKREFVTASFFSVLTFLSWIYFTHINGFAPFRYFIRLPQILKGDYRYGFTFGTGHYNIVGNFAFCGFVLLFSIIEYKNELPISIRKYKNCIFIYAIVLFTVVLVSSTSRGEIIGVFIFILMIVLEKSINRLFSKKEKKIVSVLLSIAIIVVVITVIGWTFKVDSLSGRSNNFIINYNVFERIGNKMTGMGYMEAFGFLNNSYGYDTWPCDVYYLYIYFTTGIVGSIIMGGALIFMVLSIIRRKGISNYGDYVSRAMIIAVLFNNIYHCTLNSYYYIASLVISILTIEHLYEVDYKGKRQ